MWRCRCGETNLAKDDYCRACEGPRQAAQRTEGRHTPSRRAKAVQVGFFGLGMDEPRGDDPDRDERPLSDAELDAHYEESRRRSRLTWIVYGLAALAILSLLLWQIFRSE